MMMLLSDLWSFSRVCQTPDKRVSLEKAFKHHDNLCGRINFEVETNRLCNGTNSPPETDNTFIEELVNEYARENFAVVKIFIKDPYYTNIKRDQAMTMVSFVGNAGGLAGLCMGMSFVSAFEIFYHIVNFCCGLRGKNRVEDFDKTARSFK